MSQWIQVDITTTTEGIEPVTAVLLDLGLSHAVQDPEDFQSFLDGKQGHWDYIDDKVMELKQGATIVTVYLSHLEEGINQLADITRELDRLKFLANGGEWGALTYTLKGVEEEEWATAWKQYYHPIHITKNLTICPEWIPYEGKDGEIVVTMDPGMAFGTGTHESTKLCLEFLAENSKGGENILDIGSGSGILSIAAILLGGERAVGVDISQVAVETGRKNADINGIGHKVEYLLGSLAENVQGKFNLIFANIVADAIISLAKDIPELLEKDGIFIASGIIDTRADEVENVLVANGLKVVGKKEEKGWVAFLSQRK